jgi:hypothetical protein
VHLEVGAGTRRGRIRVGVHGSATGRGRKGVKVTLTGAVWWMGLERKVSAVVDRKDVKAGLHIFYPSYSLLLLPHALPSTTHFTLKVQAERSSTILHDVTTQKTTT